MANIPLLAEEHQPTRKVTFGGLAGALSVLAIWLLTSYGVDVSAEKASALTTVLTFLVSYIVVNSDQ
jgi:hypothetical protein